MAQENIIIIGGGFAGLVLAERLSARKNSLGTGTRIILIDKKDDSHFLPGIPDIIGRGVPSGIFKYPIAKHAARHGYVHLKHNVTSIDPTRNVVEAGGFRIGYEYLVIAAGSETNFYGNDKIKNAAFRFDDADDVVKVLEAVNEDKYERYLICGGGYTGVEIATSLRIFLSRGKKNKEIHLVEAGSGILGPMPEWIKEYTRANLAALGINVLTGVTVRSYENGIVTLSDGMMFDNSMLVWSAGVKTPAFVEKTPFSKERQGRLSVDEYLRVKDNIFVAGDCAGMTYKGELIRMGIQFSIEEAGSIARNIARDIRRKKLRRFVPIDPGYIIPMANNLSCGMVFGRRVRGRAATCAHYLMCLVRLRGLKNKKVLFTALMRKRT
ncbi:MAG: FAD-dependent oxidoreductase [Candidatus Omnitrophica bacterium]|nr:FAD-dependent oxidoreductase [Candidatus Omnitrophota bacterium]MDD5488599.1 FAD-dependent oxidoreductase [Candidatus Omnitrophota bacterium]